MSAGLPLDEDLLEALCACPATESRVRVWQAPRLAVDPTYINPGTVSHDMIRFNISRPLPFNQVNKR